MLFMVINASFNYIRLSGNGLGVSVVMVYYTK
jgi:hypothetical protein